jgi:hypothetical protein
MRPRGRPAPRWTRATFWFVRVVLVCWNSALAEAQVRGRERARGGAGGGLCGCWWGALSGVARRRSEGGSFLCFCRSDETKNPKQKTQTPFAPAAAVSLLSIARSSAASLTQTSCRDERARSSAAQSPRAFPQAPFQPARALQREDRRRRGLPPLASSPRARRPTGTDCTIACARRWCASLRPLT